MQTIGVWFCFIAGWESVLPELDDGHGSVLVMFFLFFCFVSVVINRRFLQ